MPDWDLKDENDNLVRVIDSGHDNYAFMWDFWNNKDYYNIGYNITYDVPDGWLNEWMPTEMPDEGVFVDMSCKVFCKGKIFDWSYLVQLHINHNLDITANFVKL